MHDIEALQLRIEDDERRRDDREIFRDIVGDRERRESAARHEELLADFDDLDELRRISVEIDHIACFPRRGQRIVARIITVLIPIWRNSPKRSLMPPLMMSFR